MLTRKCKWIGTVVTLEKHVAKCEFSLLPCPKECKDRKKKVRCFMRKDLNEHLKSCLRRDYKCEYCGEKGTYTFITRNHDKIYLKKILPCPNAECTDTMQRHRIEKHVTKCEYTMTPCKFKRIGCKTELKRKDIAAHEEDDKLHLHMAINMTAVLEKESKDQTAKLEEELEVTKDKVADLEEELDGAKDEVADLKEELDTAKDKVADLEEELEDIKDKIKNKPQLKFRFTDYQRRKIYNEHVNSPSYHTSINGGYCMALQVYANGCGKGQGTHVSVFARFLQGIYNAELKWPFEGKVTFTLLNQLEDKNHHQVTSNITRGNNAQAGGVPWGHLQFIPQAKLGYDSVKNTQYLKDDTLHFRMSVELPQHNKPWLQI